MKLERLFHFLLLLVESFLKLVKLQLSSLFMQHHVSRKLIRASSTWKPNVKVLFDSTIFI